MRIALCLLSIAILGMPAKSPADEPAAYDPPTVSHVEAAPEFNRLFEGHEGWIGGDCAYSEPLAKDRVLWLFGDTLIGRVKDNGRAGAAFINNTIGVQRDKGAAPIEFLHKTADNKPASFFAPADGKGWFWPQGPVLVGKRLYVFLAQIDKGTDPGVLGFQQIGQWLAIIDNPFDDPAQWKVRQQQLTQTEFTPKFERSFGSAALLEGEYVYIYGYSERDKGFGKKQLIVARAPAASLEDFATWRYQSADGWNEKPEDVAPQAKSLATEFSVSRTPDGKAFVLVQTDNGLGDRIVGRYSPTPHGPWSAALPLYRCPEMLQDKRLFCYAAKAHRQHTTGNSLLISYCVNSHDFGQLFKDQAIYRPKFVRVELKHDD